MKLSIRRKLILSICVPLVLIYVALLAVDYYHSRQIASEQMRLLVTSQAETFAAKLDARFREIAQMVESTAEHVAARTTFREAELYRTVASDIQRNPLILASTIAFAPDLVPGKDLYAPTARREAGNKIVLEDIAAKGDYSAGAHPWYDAPRDKLRPVWSDPFVDETSPERTVIVTYAAPMRRGDRFLGVVAARIRLTDLQAAVQKNNPSSDGFILIDTKGTFVSHPRPEFILKRSLFVMAQELNRPDMAEVGYRALTGEAGVVRIAALGQVANVTDDSHHWVAFAPVKSTGWAFATAVPERLVMGPIRERLWRSVGFFLAGLGLIVAAAMRASIRVSEPIERLAKVVHDVAAGDLGAQVQTIDQNDEIGALAQDFNRMVRTLKEHMAELAAQTSAREKVESELRVGRQIQSFLLPRKFPPYPERREFELHGINVPARQVAGDFFDFFLLGPDTLAFVIADVSGKGVPAALFMAVARTIIRNLAQSGLSPAEVLTQANTRLLEDNPAAMFVTLFLGQYHIPTGKIVYGNAGHPPPFVIGANATIEEESYDPQTSLAADDAVDRDLAIDSHFGSGKSGVVTLNPPSTKIGLATSSKSRIISVPQPFGIVTGPLLGALPADQIPPFKEAHATLRPGETLLLYTDGVTEARGPSGRFFGDAGLRGFLVANGHEPVDRLCGLAVETVDHFQNYNRHDDITVMALRRKR